MAWHVARPNDPLPSRHLSRLEFLRAGALAGLAATQPLAFLVKLSANVISTTGFNSRWSDAACQTLRKMQEREYTRLGKQLGLSGDPLTVYQSFSAGQIPDAKISSKRFEEIFGTTLNIAEDREELENTFKNYVDKYRDADLPTPYEEPTMYATLLEMADSIEEVAKSINLPIPRHLLFGTLPSAKPNAMAIPVPQTKDYIVVFHFGLFLFAYHMSVLAAAAFPPLVPDKNQIKFGSEPVPELALRRNPEILRYFNRILYSYIVLGNPRLKRLTLEPPSLIMASILLRSMELFILGHEYTHIIWRHAEKGKEFQESYKDAILWSWQAEYNADEVGLSLMSRVQSAFDLKYVFWSADYYLSCMDITERCLSVLRGSGVRDAEQFDHPPLTERRERLYSVLRDVRPGADAEKSIALAVQLHTFLDGLWKQSLPHWVALSKKGVKASGIWQ